MKLTKSTQDFKLENPMNESVQSSLKATIFFDGSFWIGVFERTNDTGYTVARTVFGGEPTEPEFYQYVIHHFSALQFGAPQKREIEEKKTNPKRAQREARKEMEKLKNSSRPCTFAQSYMKEELEKYKKEKKKITREEKEAREQEQFLIRQAKKKEKHRGH